MLLIVNYGPNTMAIYRKELLETTGITHDALRYYLKLGLLDPRKVEHKWQYSDKDVETIQLICSLKSVGFSVKEIQKLTNALKDTNCKHQASIPFLKEKLEEISRGIKKLEESKKTITRALMKFETQDCSKKKEKFVL